MIDRLIHFLLYRLTGPEFFAGLAATAGSIWLGRRLWITPVGGSRVH